MAGPGEKCRTPPSQLGRCWSRDATKGEGMAVSGLGGVVEASQEGLAVWDDLHDEL